MKGFVPLTDELLSLIEESHYETYSKINYPISKNDHAKLMKKVNEEDEKLINDYYEKNKDLLKQELDESEKFFSNN